MRRFATEHEHLTLLTRPVAQGTVGVSNLGQ